MHIQHRERASVGIISARRELSTLPCAAHQIILTTTTTMIKYIRMAGSLVSCLVS